jgi:hypothetical protein
LFSRDDVARLVNDNFEAVWESVRPVPLVHIDFGNGTVLTRTLHGNIATYACAADGQVLDVVAGIYTPDAYKERLTQLRLLANYVDQEGAAKRTDRLVAYHNGQRAALKKGEPVPEFFNAAIMSKARIEGGMKAVLVAGRKKPAPPAPAKDPGALTAEDLASFQFLLQDTQANETVRRKQVHELLAGRGAVKPAAVTKTVYKDILHADIDDPYLGLGPTLFTNYPFKDEDAKGAGGGQ